MLLILCLYDTSLLRLWPEVCVPQCSAEREVVMIQPVPPRELRKMAEIVLYKKSSVYINTPYDTPKMISTLECEQ